MNYIKQNHLSLLIVLWLVMSAVFSASAPLKDVPNLGAANRESTTITNPFIFTQGATLQGTTTIVRSPDGFVAWSGYVVATGTAKAVFTNTGAPMMCDADSGFIRPKGTTFAPSIVLALGTSTSATGHSVNLIASTTVATTTTSVIPFTYALPFVLGNNESIVGGISDYSAAIASSTFFSNWSIEFGVHCWTMGS